MKLKAESDIIAATRPEEIFTMNLDYLEQEKSEYLKQFEPTEYRTVQNFRLRRKILLLYEQAKVTIDKGYNEKEVCFKSVTGKEYKIHYINNAFFKLGTMYETARNVIYYVEKKYEKYYNNYISKTNHYLKPNKEIWERVEYSLPNVREHFKTVDGDFVIILEKPTETMYSLRTLLEYFGGSMKPEYVASILSRLYYFACYMSLTETVHNGITLDGLFFQPGKRIPEMEKANIHTWQVDSLEDLRVVGVYGGWFFSTFFDEKITGMPREIYEIIPKEVKTIGYSTFKVDGLSIKKVARDLLGNHKNIPKPFWDWINSTVIADSPIVEFENWEKVILDSFGARRFIDMEVNLS